MTSYFSLAMLGAFLPATMLAYQIIPRRARWAVLLAASYALFWSISGTLIVYLLAATVTIWLTGLGLGRLIQARAEALKEPGAERRTVKRAYQRRMKAVLALGILVNMGMLFSFKYVPFTARTLAPLATPLLAPFGITWPEHVTGIAAPIGISFYTLQAISYLVDVYRQRITSDTNLGRLALYLAFFPQIMEGPICRYDQTAGVLMAGNPITAEGLSTGAVRICWGLAKQYLVANRVNILVKAVFASSGSYGGGITLLAGALYTLQLYCDFSGTMDFVVGTGRIFGVRLPENFRQPFFSRTASEFWQRWHITLGLWLRDYVFYPVSLSTPVKHAGHAARKLLGNHMGSVAVSGIALLAVWFGNGLWHGAGGQYVLFGLYWFAAIWLGGFAEVLAQEWCPRLSIRRDGKVWRALQHVRTLGIVVVGEIIFRAPGGRAALQLLAEAVRNPSIGTLFDGTVAKLGLSSADAVCLLIALAALLVVGLMRERGAWSAERLWRASHLAPCLMCCALFFIVIIFGAYGTGYVPVDPMYASF